MAGIREFNSFVRKFTNLWKSGHAASLKAETRAGEAWVELHVGLGVTHPVQGGQQHQGNARQRRRERRAAERAAADVKDNTEVVIDKVGDDSEEKAAEEAGFESEKDGTVQITISSEVNDEILDEYPENKILDIEVIGDLVDKILVTHGEVDQQKDDTENVMEGKLRSVGIEIENIESVLIEEGKSKMVVKIKPIDKKKVNAATYPLCVLGWSIECV